MKHFPPHEWINMRKVLGKEGAGGNPLSVSGVNYDGSRDYGCFMINLKRHPLANWADANANADMARQVWQQRGRGGTIGWAAWCASEKAGVIINACSKYARVAR